MMRLVIQVVRTEWYEDSDDLSAGRIYPGFKRGSVCDYGGCRTLCSFRGGGAYVGTLREHTGKHTVSSGPENL